MSSLSAEALLAVTGLFPESPPSPKDGKDAARLPKRWALAAKNFLRSEKWEDFELFDRPDPEETYEKLVISPRTEKLVDRLADPRFADEYLEVLGRARRYVAALWPYQILDTPTGPEWLEPSTASMGRAWSVLAVINRPDRLLEELQAGALAPEQAAAFREVYPELFRMLGAMLQAELSVMAERKRKLPADRTLVLRTLLGLPGQMSIAVPKDEAGDGAPEAPGPQVKIDFRKLQTRSQRIDERL